MNNYEIHDQIHEFRFDTMNLFPYEFIYAFKNFKYEFIHMNSYAHKFIYSFICDI